jgi:hypothetical protein
VTNPAPFPLTVLGYDPGGSRSHGVAILCLDAGGVLTGKVATLRNVHEVFTWFRDGCAEAPHAVGIDTLLAWPTQSNAGWRCVDSHLRETYPAVANSVVAANSLYGAMCLNGMAPALKLQQKWPNIILNETHPKVLYYALTGRRYSFSADMNEWLCESMHAGNDAQIRNEHEWDALISAWFTLRSATSSSPRDLFTEFHAEELVCPVKDAHYFWL